jgi:hypothetical protein
VAPVVVLIVGLGFTVGLTIATWSVHDDNEHRLLGQRTREAVAVLSTAVPVVQTPLASAAELAEGTNGDVDAFTRFVRPQVEEKRFASVSLWSVAGAEPRPLAVVGDAPVLATQPAAAIRRELDRAAGAPSLTVVNLLDRAQPRLGYALTSPQAPARYVVYAESALPPDRRGIVQQGSAFDNLNYALYLGDRADPANLLQTSAENLPIPGRREFATAPFGDSQLLLVMSPTGELGGALMGRLPWIIAITGIALSAGVAALVGQLARRRREAEWLSAANRALYERERTIAQTLQRSLLPERLPDCAAVELAARYEPGVEGVEIGGDWYDVIDLGADRLFLVVGDVSGRGLGAAATMASLRFSTRAYARQGHSPAETLTMLGDLLDVGSGGHFATMLCARIDLDRRELLIANAGHPSPVLVEGAHARLLPTAVGLPVGVQAQSSYEMVTVRAAPGATFVAFTDGLVERRGESVDVGLERVRQVAEDAQGSVDELLSRLLAEVATGMNDDTALIGLQWRTAGP